MHILKCLETTDHFHLNNCWRAVVDNNVIISFMFYLQRMYTLSIMHLCLKWKLIPEQSMAANFSHCLHFTIFIAKSFFWKLLRNNLVARRRKVNNFGKIYLWSLLALRKNVRGLFFPPLSWTPESEYLLLLLRCTGSGVLEEVVSTYVRIRQCGLCFHFISVEWMICKTLCGPNICKPTSLLHIDLDVAIL